jgi:hypothetical protein
MDHCAIRRKSMSFLGRLSDNAAILVGASTAI